MMDTFQKISGGVCAAKGFRGNGVHCGIRKNKSKRDLALIVSESPCAAAAVYTQNKVKGAPIAVTKEHLADGRAQAVIVNSGNANTCNADGVQKARMMCGLASRLTGIAESDVIVASTGVIGEPLPIEPILAAGDALLAGLSESGGDAAAEAIMTTDTFSKQAAVAFSLNGKTCRIGGMAKGSGMIHPNMATMLGFLTTDARISPALLQKALQAAVDTSFNMVSIDGDTSTNDMVTVLANGASGAEIAAEDDAYAQFAQALRLVCTDLAKQLAKDGEGASKLLECRVQGAPDLQTARAVAKSVITSSLFKAAMFGADANWGRVLCAIGYAEGDFAIDRVSVSFASKAGEIRVCEQGAGLPFDEDRAKQVLLEDEIVIHIDLLQGDAETVAWGCDLTYDYVRINGDYRT